MTYHPEVTVIIPTRNRRQMLMTRSLACALAQEDIDLEVVVVDDNSTDDTQEALAEVDDERLITVRQDPHKGVSAARNRGIDMARGEWIAFLDDDDRWLPGRLRATIDAGIEAGADFVLGTTIVVDEEGRKLAVAEPPPADRLQEEIRLAGTVVGPSSVIVRTALARCSGGFDVGLSYLADWELWIRFATLGKGAVCSESLVEYLQHEGSMLLDDDLDIPREFDHLSRRHPDMRVDPVGLTRWFASRYRAEGRKMRAARVYMREAIRYGEPGSLLRATVVLCGEAPMRAAGRVRLRMLRARLLRPRTAEDEVA